MVLANRRVDKGSNWLRGHKVLFAELKLHKRQDANALPNTLDVNSFCNFDRIVDVDAEILDRTLDFRVSQQEL